MKHYYIQICITFKYAVRKTDPLRRGLKRKSFLLPPLFHDLVRKTDPLRRGLKLIFRQSYRVLIF